MPDLLIFAADVVAISALTFGVFFRRHRRRDLLLPYIGINLAVLAVCAVLSTVSVGIGVGLGLFGVLAIVRLRSTELSQEEVVYYFASLALGLIAGLQPDPRWLAPLLSGAIVLAFFLLDQPALFSSNRHQVITVDAVYPSEAELKERLEQLLGADVERMVVISTDLVRDLTVVDVRYRQGARPGVVRPVVEPSAAHPGDEMRDVAVEDSAEFARHGL